MTRLFVCLAALVLLADPAAGAGAAAGEAADTAASAQTSSGPPLVVQTAPSTPTGKPAGSFGTFLSENHEAFRTYGLIIGATIGLIFAFWRAKIATRQAGAAAARADAAIEQARAANEQARVANGQARIAEQGHITERFSRAVEHLGHDRVAVRIGGIYALKRIAEDSVERDHLAVMDVLTNFIRQPPYTKEQHEAAERDKALRVFRTNSAKENVEADQIAAADQTTAAAVPPPEPELIDCPDIVAAIEIIQGRSEDQKAVEKKQKYQLSLYRASLSYLRLPRVNLRDFYLMGAHLRGANLNAADLTGANLGNANFTGAILTYARLTGATLMRAVFKSADLTNATLRDVTLWQSTLTDANLTDAVFTDANLNGANLEGANNLTQQQLDSACINKGLTPPTLSKGLKPPQKECVL